MHLDLLDAVQWSIDAKVADAAKIAIVGADYGGYAALVGLSFTPDKFACGVNEMGPSNLETFVRHLPPFFRTQIEAETTIPVGIVFLVHKLDCKLYEILVFSWKVSKRLFSLLQSV